MLDQVHPFVVHFPIALLPAALLLELLSRFFRARAGVAVDVLVLLGGLGAVAAAVTGDATLGSLVLEGSRAAAARGHERAADLAVWIAIAAILTRGAWRLSLHGRGGRPELPWVRRALETLALGLLLGATAAALRAGHLGGDLVHEQGVTRATAPHRANDRPAGTERYETEPGAR